MLKNFMYFVVLTFAVVLVWIGLSVYRNLNPTEPVNNTQVIPIEGSFDFDTIQKLKNRIVVPADFTTQFVSTPSPRLTTTPQPSTTSGTLNVDFVQVSPSAEFTATPSGI